MAAHHERLETAQADGRAAVLRWQRELLPSYQHSWQQVYRHTRMEGPPRPADGVPAWWR